MRKIYETIAEALAERKNQLAMKRGIAMLLALSIMLLAVPTVAITAIYAEGDAETEETSGGETTVSTDADETGTTTSTAETTTTAATDDTTTAAEGETTTTTTENTSTASAGDDSVTTTASEVSTTASSTENTTTTSVDDNAETTTAAEETTTATTEETTTTSETEETTTTAATTTAAAAPIADYGELKISMTTLLPTGSSMDLNFNATGTIYIDWGDGNIVEYSADGVTAGSNIKIYCADNITYLDCRGNQLTTLDVSNNTALQNLYCGGNQLTTLDVSNNVELWYLYCDSNQLTTLDVSNNVELWRLDCDGNQLTTLDVSNNTALQYLYCGGNQLTTLDVSNNVELWYLYCDSNQLTTLDFSNNTALQYLSCGGNQLTTLDFSNNVALTDLSCTGNQLTALDVRNSVALTELSCNNNQLTALDVSNNTALTWLSCDNNKLSTLNVSNNTALTWLSCYNNPLTTLDVRNNVELKNLLCNNNQLTALDVSNNTALEWLICNNNKLTALDVSNNTELSALLCGDNMLTELDVPYNGTEYMEIQCQNNKLRYSTMGTNIVKYSYLTSYSPQSDISISEMIEPNEKIDLSSEYDINGTKTVYTWYNAADDSVVTPTTSENGVFTFGDDFAGKTLYCTMTNDEFPELTLTTTEVTVEGTIDLGEPQIVMTTALPIGSTMNLDISTNAEDDMIYIDWGDGNLVEWTADGVIAGEIIKIYSTGAIDSLNCSDNQLSMLDVSGSTSLEGLNCATNQLQSINLKNNTELKWLSCSGNLLKSLDISANTAIEILNCDENQLTSLDISANTAIEILNCGENQLTSLDTSSNEKLRNLGCNDNLITNLDFSNNKNLHNLLCYNNQLKTLDVTDIPELAVMNCSDNQLSTLNINDLLIGLICSGNQLTMLDLSNNDTLNSLTCTDNNFLFSTLPLDNGRFYTDTFIGDKVHAYVYSPQGLVTIKSEINCAEAIDLSSEYSIDGNITTYIWYNAADDSVVTPTTSENGVFTFGDAFIGKTLYCTMTNNEFPELTLTTTKVTVEEAKEEFEVVDKEDYVGEAEPSDDLVVEDEKGSEVEIGNVRLIIGNVAENNKKTVREAIEAYNKEFKATDNNHAMYDIRLETDKGVKVNIVDGRILICLKYPDNLGAECTDYTYHLYHIKDDGTVEEITIEAKPNGIWFYADDFSPYVLTYTLNTTTTTATTTTTTSTTTASTKSTVAGDSDKKEGNTPETGDNSLGTIIVMTFNLVLVMMMVSVLVFRWYQKSHTAAAAVDAEVMADAAVFDLIGIAELSQSDEFEDLE